MTTPVANQQSISEQSLLGAKSIYRTGRKIERSQLLAISNRSRETSRIASVALKVAPRTTLLSTTPTKLTSPIDQMTTTSEIIRNQRISPVSSSARVKQIIDNNKFNNNNQFKLFYCNSSKLAFLAMVTFMTILLLTCLANQQVSSLNCYTCSSADNPGCDESFSGRENITDTDCTKHIDKPAKVCRKLVQYLEHKKVVIRSCGWIDEHEEKKPMCYKRSGTFALMMESCICYEDNCNHSASLVPNLSVLILLTSGSILFCYIASKQRDRQAH